MRENGFYLICEKNNKVLDGWDFYAYNSSINSKRGYTYEKNYVVLWIRNVNQYVG